MKLTSKSAKSGATFIEPLTLTAKPSTLLLTAKRDAKAAKRFLTKALNVVHAHAPRVINSRKNSAYPPAVEQL